MKRFYLADWHYGHKNVIAFDNRPFQSVEDMDRALVDNWNRVVGRGDIVYVLGDMFWVRSTEAVQVLQSLNGMKFLIRGNHDRSNDSRFVKQFEKVTDYLEVEDEGRKLILCHYPIPCFKNHYRGWYHLYGHVHISFEHNMMEHDKYLMKELYEVPCNMFNAGVMMPYMNYTPRTLDEIIQANEGGEVK